MKKYVLILAVSLFAFSMNTQAQVKATFGLKGGMNVSSLTGDVINPKAKVGMHFGALVQVSLSEYFSIQPEVVYSLEGNKSSGGNQNINTNLNMLNIPVMLQYEIVDGFLLEAGPQIGFFLSAKQKAGNQSVDIKNVVKGTNFGMGVGAGWRHDSGFGVGARYNFGLSNIYNGQGNAKIKSNAFQISLYYMLSKLR